MAKEEKNNKEEEEKTNKEEEEKKEKEGSKENPIDEESITDNPGTLSYPHQVGGQPIRPVDKSKVKGRAVAAMQEQTDQQLGQIRKQMEVLAEQARDIQNRVDVSQKIYEAETSFEPHIGHTYYLYARENGQYVLSMIGPDDWGKRMPFHEYVSTVKLLSDHTWEVLD